MSHIIGQLEIEICTLSSKVFSTDMSYNSNRIQQLDAKKLYEKLTVLRHYEDELCYVSSLNTMLLKSKVNELLFNSTQPSNGDDLENILGKLPQFSLSETPRSEKKYKPSPVRHEKSEHTELQSYPVTDNNFGFVSNEADKEAQMCTDLSEEELAYYNSLSYEGKQEFMFNRLLGDDDQIFQHMAAQRNKLQDQPAGNKEAELNLLKALLNAPTESNPQVESEPPADTIAIEQLTKAHIAMKTANMELSDEDAESLPDSILSLDV